MTKRVRIVLVLLFSIIISGVTGFVVAPLFTKPENIVSVVVLNSDVEKGTLITKELLRTKEITEDYLHDEIVIESNEVIGTYAKNDLYKDDLINKNSLSLDFTKSENDFISKETTKENFYFTVTIKSLASGTANKLLPEDIVSISSLDEEEEKAILFDELKYVRVVDVVNQYGQSIKANPTKEELKENMTAAIILEVNQPQLEILTKYEYEGNLHVSFFYRGSKEECDSLLVKQNSFWESK